MQTHAVNGALAIGIAQLIKLPFQIGSLIVLPRLLQPIDYGIYAMIDPLIAIAALILNFGISQAVIQAPADAPNQSPPSRVARVLLDSGNT